MLTNKLPAPVLYLLMFIAGMSLALTGFNAGVEGRIRRWRLNGFALVLTGLMLIVIDLDRPEDGLMRVQPTSLEATIADMQADLAQSPE